MLDMRLTAMTLAILIALVSVSLADAVMDRSPSPASNNTQNVAQSSGQARPIRVILPASWEPSKEQAEAQPTR